MAASPIRSVRPSRERKLSMGELSADLANQVTAPTPPADEKREYSEKLIKHQIDKYTIKRSLLNADLPDSQREQLQTELAIIKECISVIKTKLGADKTAPPKT
jgi:hypothetical protein